MRSESDTEDSASSESSAETGHRDGRPVCAACGYCSENSDMFCCATCEKDLHVYCSDLAKLQSEKTGVEGCCEECYLKQFGSSGLVCTPMLTRMLRCKCSQVSQILVTSTQSFPKPSAVTTMPPIEQARNKSTMVRSVADPRTIASKNDAMTNNTCRRNQRKVPLGEVEMPNIVMLHGEYLLALRKQDEGETNQEDDLNSVEIDMEVDKGAGVEPLYAIQDRAMYLDACSGMVVGTVIETATKPKLCSSSVRGTASTAPEYEWTYAIRTINTEDSAGNSEEDNEDNSGVKWMYESSFDIRYGRR